MEQLRAQFDVRLSWRWRCYVQLFKPTNVRTDVGVCRYRREYVLCAPRHREH